MIEIRRSALVAYRPDQMFDLVNDVEAYPTRFNWCARATVLERDGAELVAKLDLKFAGLRHSFTTRNTGEAPERIKVELVEGPFRSLEGQWTFAALGDSGCRVGLVLEFDYTGRLASLALKLGFQSLASRMVDDFCKQARAVYG